jgi:hypothetical protein
MLPTARIRAIVIHRVKRVHLIDTRQRSTEAINEVLPFLSLNKVGKIPKSTLYRCLLEKNYFTRQQLAPTSFYRFIRENDLLATETTEKLRTSFAMQHANELWQADTMYGPSIQQSDGKWKKTFLIAFIDDASRLITHAEFFYRDNTDNMVDAFRTALYKRGKPERLYFAYTDVGKGREQERKL